MTQPVPDMPTGNTVLRNLITRLLAKQPGGRPQDARAVLERLQRVVLPRSRLQEAIAKGLSEHDNERSREAAARAAARTAREMRGDQVEQAVADLDEVVDDALEDLRQTEPEARVGRDHGGEEITMSCDDIKLRIDIWLTGAHGSVVHDTMMLAAGVHISNRLYEKGLRAANLVFEAVGGRLAWQLYRFRPGLGQSANYTFGPSDRAHGLKHEDFFGQLGRHFMVNPAVHVWQKDVRPLTATTLLELFREAVDLRPPDPRTGAWPVAG